MRHVPLAEPDALAQEKYLRVWHSGALFHKPESFPRLASHELFGNDRALELEIGCSTGEYLCAMAQVHPERNYVGIEINLKSLYVAVHNARELGLDNITFIKAPVQDVYRLMPPNSLQAVYMHFPDPSLHPKYRKRRIFTQEFLDKMHTALTPAGILSVVTDKEPLFWDMLALVETDARFEKTHAERFLVGFEPLVKSRYQAYWERHGVTIYRFEVRHL